jgi:hypothetical protein
MKPAEVCLVGLEILDASGSGSVTINQQHLAGSIAGALFLGNRQG